MIELISSAAMILSSMYGPTQASASTSASTINASTSASSTPAITQPIDVMAYVKSQYAADPILIDIARCESGFRQYDKEGNLVHGNVNKADIGVMQINEVYHLEKSIKLGYDIRTTEGNVAYARYLYESQGAAPWSASQKCWSPASNNQVALNK